MKKFMCEALYPRIGIMPDGRLKCLGSAQHLKPKYGKGFEVEAKIRGVVPDDDHYQLTLMALLRNIIPCEI